MVLINGTARVGWAEDYPVGVSEAEIGAGRTQAALEPVLIEGVPRDITNFAPSLAHRVGFQEWWGRAARRGASPATASAFNVLMFGADVREYLSDIKCPVLVLSRVEGVANMVEHGRYLAEHIDGARFLRFAGTDLVPWAGAAKRARIPSPVFFTSTPSCRASSRSTFRSNSSSVARH